MWHHVTGQVASTFQRIITVPSPPGSSSPSRSWQHPQTNILIYWKKTLRAPSTETETFYFVKPVMYQLALILWNKDNGKTGACKQVWEIDVTRTAWKNYTLHNHKTNKEIRTELNIHNLNKIIVDYRCRWPQHLLQVNNTHIPSLVYEYFTPSKRKVVKIRKRCWNNQPWRQDKPWWLTHCCYHCCLWRW